MRFLTSFLAVVCLAGCGGGGSTSDTTGNSNVSVIYSFAAQPFNNVTNAEYAQAVTSNALSIAGLGTGNAASVTVNAGTTIIKNGIAASTTQATVRDGDSLALRRTSSAFGQTTSATVTSGTSSATWQITTKIPQIVFDAEGSTPYVAPQDSNVYFAVPFKPTSAFTAHYAGISIGSAVLAQGVYSDWVSLAVYSDNAGVPGSVLTSTNQFFTYFTSPLSRPDGSIFSNYSNPQAKLNDPGLPLLANTIYWIVVQYPTASTPSYDKATFSTTGLLRKMSSNGINWVNWAECCNASGLNYSASYLPGLFLAN